MDVPATLRVLRSLQASGLAWMSRVRSREQVVASVEGHLRALALPAAALPPIVHVAGTKGKGSTCAMVEAALRAAGLRTGLFTSPHLVCPTERICINGAPVAREAYLREFEGTLRALRAARAPHDDGDPPDLPGFTLLLLVAYRLFLAARLDVLVLEVSVGGLLCPTNALPAAQVLASGVTLLDLDHVAVLGATLPLIAAQKAGILRRGVPACAARPAQAPVARVLAAAAAGAGAPLWWAPSAQDLAAASPGGALPQLGLAGRFQAGNAALAAALAELALQRLRGGGGGGASASALPAAAAPLDASGVADDEALAARVPVYALARGAAAAGAAAPAQGHLAPAILEGLRCAVWPGRAQRLRLRGLRLHLDGAHTALSMGEVALWFRACAAESEAVGEVGRGGAPTPAPAPVALIFYCGRDKCSEAMLALLAVTAPWAQVHIVDLVDTGASGGGGGAGVVGEGGGGEGPWGAALAGAWARAASAAAEGRVQLPGEQVPEGCASWADWLAREEGSGGGSSSSSSSGASLAARQPAAQLHADVGSALQRIEATLGSGARVLVTGSLYLVGAALQAAREGGEGGR